MSDNKHIEEEAIRTMDLMGAADQVSSNPYLYSKIRERLSAPETKAGSAPKYALAVAGICALAIVNIAVLMSSGQRAEQDGLGAEIIDDYGINENYFNFYE